MPRRVSVQPIIQSPPEAIQQTKNMDGTKVIKDQATQTVPLQEEDYCSMCTQHGVICPRTWHKFSPIWICKRQVERKKINNQTRIWTLTKGEIIELGYL